MNWSKTMVSVGGYLPEVLYPYNLEIQLKAPMKEKGLDRVRELWRVEREGQHDLYMIYDYTWSEEIMANVGNLKGPMTADQVLKMHPEFWQLGDIN